MKLLAKQNILPPDRDDIVFRISLWGTLFGFLFLLSGLLVGLALFIYSYQSSVTWGMVLSGLYSLFMWFFCRILFRTLMANRSAANWLARIGPNGILIKYRSYLHDDSPEEDPIALHLSWPEIADAQLQQELYTITDMDGKSQTRHWFLAIKLDPHFLDIDRIKSALVFESQRKPAHFKVDDLKHELFIAHQSKAAESEIAHLKQEIALEKKRHPGKHSKWRFKHRPVVFIGPDILKIEWDQITPGKKALRKLLVKHTTVSDGQQQQFDIEKPMSEAEFKSLLETLLDRDQTIEALKLVRIQRGLSTTEAKAFIDKARQQG